MVNLPNKNREIKLNYRIEIEGLVEPVDMSLMPLPFSMHIVKRDPTESSFYKICDIDAATPEGMARQIAQAIREARDIGFEQGREYVRDALGIKDN